LQTWHFLRIFAKRQVENENIIIHNQVLVAAKKAAAGGNQYMPATQLNHL